MSEVYEKGKKAKKASYQLGVLTSTQKNTALVNAADRLLEDVAEILAANRQDLDNGEQNGITPSVLDRILLNEQRIHDIAEALRLLAALPDPVGQTLETIQKDNGLAIEKVRVPLGVIGIIYEARPNVTADAAALALKTGNAVILRGSSSAVHSNKAITSSIQQALLESGLPAEAVQLIEDTSRTAAKELFHLREFLDVLIPRGGKGLIETVVREASVPVIETGAGNCHVYIAESADRAMAESIVINGKTQRPSVCNAVESLLIDEHWFKKNGLSLLEALSDRGVVVKGDPAVCRAFVKAEPAEEEDWGTEYLSLTISVRLITSTAEAIEHINRYGSNHSEAIVTEDRKEAELFLHGVDAAAVYHNASPRFTDGFEFGYGAEIGISTQKLHARGPMGLNALTSSKYIIRGNGQIRG